ncbi:protein POLAR-like 1 [Punica granatum]|uniref:Protein POLAR-like 1 n=1 Tax=Punica granatum TaxID=22663 RepID=A0A6P8EMS0_PUNGR|nr:protein POLAR-like 1 [Punica granatum]
MDQLEAELEAELERLQLQLETESYPQSKKITGNDSTTKRSGSLSLGEVVDLDDSMTEVHGGVPPIELERRLHELLESRQQERIKELEASLKCIKLKLSEKGREAKWWKDTALLMSSHVPEPPDLSQKQFRESCKVRAIIIDDVLVCSFQLYLCPWCKES